jgi:hypothetical protein
MLLMLLLTGSDGEQSAPVHVPQGAVVASVQ